MLTLWNRAIRRRATLSAVEVNRSRSSVALNATKESLRILREALDGVPVPGLKGAVGGLLAALDLIDTVKQNQADFEELRGYIDQLRQIIVDAMAVGLSPTLETALISLSSEIASIAESARTTLSQRLRRRVIDSSSNAQKILKDVRAISGLLQAFQLRASLEIVAKTNEIMRAAQRDTVNELPHIKSAAFNSKARESAPNCLRGTRVDVLREISIWMSNPTFPALFWLAGMAGTGKSTISQTVAEHCAESGVLAASFFFSRDDRHRDSLNLFCTTIARQLATFSLPLNIHLASALKSNPDLPHLTFRHQFMQLIIGPLRALQRTSPGTPPFPMVIVIDGLDECRDGNSVSQLLTLLIEELPKMEPLLKIFLTSRPEPSILSLFLSPEAQFAHQTFVLHNVNAHTVRKDIIKYLHEGFAEIRRDFADLLTQHSQWPSASTIDLLASRANGLFVYASTILKYIGDRRFDPRKQLQSFLDIDYDNEREVEVFFQLDRLYRHIVHSCPNVELSLSVLACLIFMFQKPNVGLIETILKLPRGTAGWTLRPLHSVVCIPNDDQTPIQLFHHSFYEFLVSPARSQGYHIDPDIQHDRIARGSYSVLRDILSYELDVNDPMRNMLRRYPNGEQMSLEMFHDFVEEARLPFAEYTRHAQLLLDRYLHAAGNFKCVLGHHGQVDTWLGRHTDVSSSSSGVSVPWREGTRANVNSPASNSSFGTFDSTGVVVNFPPYRLPDEQLAGNEPGQNGESTTAPPEEDLLDLSETTLVQLPPTLPAGEGFPLKGWSGGLGSTLMTRPPTPDAVEDLAGPPVTSQVNQFPEFTSDHPENTAIIEITTSNVANGWLDGRPNRTPPEGWFIKLPDTINSLPLDEVPGPPGVEGSLYFQLPDSVDSGSIRDATARSAAVGGWFFSPLRSEENETIDIRSIHSEPGPWDGWISALRGHIVNPPNEKPPGPHAPCPLGLPSRLLTAESVMEVARSVKRLPHEALEELVRDSARWENMLVLEMAHFVTCSLERELMAQFEVEWVEAFYQNVLTKFSARLGMSGEPEEFVKRERMLDVHLVRLAEKVREDLRRFRQGPQPWTPSTSSQSRSRSRSRSDDRPSSEGGRSDGDRRPGRNYMGGASEQNGESGYFHSAGSTSSDGGPDYGSWRTGTSGNR